jgi:hypothetical protein
VNKLSRHLKELRALIPQIVDGLARVTVGQLVKVGADPV